MARKTTDNPDNPNGTVMTQSSGDVFADLGIELTEEEKLKFYIAKEIIKTVHKKGLTQVKAAKIIGIDQAKVSEIMSGKLKSYSLDRLVRYVRLLGRDVNFAIPDSVHKNAGRILVA